jgi:8-amino-7-oxononanoate synthase
MKSKIKELLSEREKQGLLRTKKRSLNKGCTSFTCNDFLSLGTGSGASRLLMDNTGIFDETEKLLSGFKGYEDSLIFSSGYSANVGLFSAFSFLKNTEFYIDRLSHASIIDGVIMSGHKFGRYRHCDMDDLSRLLNKASEKTNKVIVTESIFSMDGDLAPLDRLIKIKQEHNAYLIVDDAHSTGIYGKNLAGISADYSDNIDAVITTFGKGMGLAGAAVSSDTDMIGFLVNFARSFIYSTALPPQVVALLKNIILDLMNGKYSKQAEKVIELSSYLRTELNRNGFCTGNSGTHIVPVILEDTGTASLFHRLLLEKNISTSLVRPPTVPTARLRIVVNAGHSMEDIQKLVKTITQIRKERS